MPAPSSTRMVVLKARPGKGDPLPEHFAVETRDLPALGPDQLAVHNIVMSVDPSMRGRLDEGEKQYTYNFEIDGPLDGSAIGIVTASTSEQIAEGAVVRHRAGWREDAVIDAAGARVLDLDLAPCGTWLSALGQTGFTAWVGLREIGRLAEGDTVFISAAAGAVGSAAGRMARLLGASRVIGSAGGPEKVARLTDELGYDAAFDYRSADPRSVLGELAPDGIDVYFDNVGGPQLVGALHNMSIGGRIALCGMISQYSENGRGQDINHFIEAVLRRVTLRGFIVRDHEEVRSEFEATVAGWLRDGQMEALQTVTDGLDHAVDGFLGMLKGANTGKALVRLDTSWEI
ncbi:MAG: NADP-dependent oxidoreductase [Acidimicrobiales bacterium]